MPAEQPRQQLPVSAHPAVLPRRSNAVAFGIFLDDLDIRDQGRTGEDAFKEIMAQHRVFRNLARQRGFKAVDVIDALAGKGAFAEQVLIHIRYGKHVRVNAAGR